jgi:hypothetical protein
MSCTLVVDVCGVITIYPFLEEHGRSPIGGRETQVGFGGFLTGGALVTHHHRLLQMSLNTSCNYSDGNIHAFTGGFPAFSSLYGIGPDSVKGCEVSTLILHLVDRGIIAGLLLIPRQVVLADGFDVEANAVTHTDLWRALKGGTSNFGG